MMPYPEALKYLNSFINYEKLDSYDYNRSLKLDRMVKLAALLGDPHKGIRCIHVAGTKGKGSTASIIYSILKKNGMQVGLYTSPHLLSFRERIRINDQLIREDDISRLLTGMKNIIDGFPEDDQPSFFEVYTALAYLYFKECKVDFAVYEVGLGGRLDATNIIDPLVSVITPISYEHTQKLGKTLREIAAEKSGIIKKGAICVSSPQQPEALEIIDKVCNEKKTKLILVGRDITFKELMSGEDKEIFDIKGIRGSYNRLESRLLGSHQVMNTATAIGAIECLDLCGITINKDAITQGVANARWDGRLDVVSRSPTIILDGAQNRSSANTLAESMKKIFLSGNKYKKTILVLGVSKDKDIKGILEELMPISDSIVLTRSRIAERALDPRKIRSAMDSAKFPFPVDIKKVALTSSVEEAVKLARSNAGVEDIILVTGSLFVVGEAMEALGDRRQCE